ncbi:trypsin-like serine peptidase [Profundibacter sp.]|uniref:trypsin-like serine peptidase n=1 Tax=Profundibacter sp. TaxID=3101071 RepID=UPI003D09BB02
MGRVDIGSDGFCTGVLLRPDIVLTAGHCLFDPETGKRNDPTGIVFKAGFSDGKSVAERKVARAVVHPDYKYQGEDKALQVRYDVALLQLSSPIPAATAAPYLVQSFSGLGDEVAVVSYAIGRKKALSKQRHCGVLGRRDGLIVFSCDVTFGSSGAPVFDMSGNRARIVSIICSGGHYDGQKVTFGMELPALVSDMFTAFRTGQGVLPVKSIKPRRLQVGSDTRSSGAKFVRP